MFEREGEGATRNKGKKAVTGFCVQEVSKCTIFFVSPHPSFVEKGPLEPIGVFFHDF